MSEIVESPFLFNFLTPFLTYFLLEPNILLSALFSTPSNGALFWSDRPNFTPLQEIKW